MYVQALRLKIVAVVLVQLTNSRSPEETLVTFDFKGVRYADTTADTENTIRHTREFKG